MEPIQKLFHRAPRHGAAAGAMPDPTPARPPCEVHLGALMLVGYAAAAQIGAALGTL